MNIKENEENSTEEVIRPGDMLRQAREQLGYSQKDIASRLRLRLSVINNIEDNIFEESQLATFTRGYVSSYAKYVGLNEKEVLAKLDQLGHAQPKEQEMQSFSRRTKREAHDSRIMGMTWGVAVIIIGLTAAWWWQSEQLESGTDLSIASTEQSQPLDESIANSDLSDPTITGVSASDINAAAEGAVVTTSEPETVLSTTNDSDLIAAVDDNEVSISTPSTVINAGTDNDSFVAEQASDVISESAESTDDGAIVSDLKLSFIGDCWIDVRDANGKRLDTGIKKTGDVLNLNGAAPFKIVLGAPSVVEMTYKGEPVDLSVYPAGKVARFKLPL
jgi:cytoskeleton protein RodZ